MAWIDRRSREAGYVAYERESPEGLQNQGWKDSDNGIVNAQGEMAQGSITLAEVQGYVYAAQVRLSQIARVKGELEAEPPLAAAG